ncbi:MAG: hypothetical protein JO279_01235 [Verrucomicrobia bacterium]|nr:hypothetical protein [Verrucomicrobiota bacterium]
MLFFTERCLAKVASLGGSAVAAWWLTIRPLVGSFITEPAAMTICALLLRQKLYDPLTLNREPLRDDAQNLAHPDSHLCAL